MRLALALFALSALAGAVVANPPADPRWSRDTKG